MTDPIRSGLERVERQADTQNLSMMVARRDTRHREQRTELEIREHCAAAAAVKGRPWYAGKLLAFQKFPNRRTANAALIQSSRRLLQESRGRIVRTKNILAFHNPIHNFVN